MKYLFLFPAVALVVSCASTKPARTSAKPKQASASAPVIAKKVVAAGAKDRAKATGERALAATKLEGSGDLLGAVHEYMRLSFQAETKQEESFFAQKGIDIVETRLNKEQLTEISSLSELGPARAHALFKLGELAMEENETSEAKTYFSSVVAFLPGSNLAFQADELLLQMDTSKFVEPRTIGVVLPLSGKNAGVGQKALRAIQIGLGLGKPGSTFSLAVVDSEGSVDTARIGVEKLVNDDNVIAIIGSLLSKTATAVAAKSSELGVPSIGLNQKAGISELSPLVFRNALTNEMQIRHLVKTAFSMGQKQFAILYPNDQYGVECANLFWDEVVARGGNITAAQSYDSKGNDFRAQAQRLVGTFYLEARSDEYREKMKEIANDPKRKKSIRKEEILDDILPPLVDFDAIFIPDSSKTMGQLASFLSYVGIKNVSLLGTNLWNSPGVGKKAGLFSDKLLFVDSGIWSSAGARFAEEYSLMFGEKPGIIELQAYDSALILRQIISSGATSREAVASRLSELKNFPGALGYLSVSNDREIQRPLVALKTVGDKIVEFQPLEN